MPERKTCADDNDARALEWGSEGCAKCLLYVKLKMLVIRPYLLLSSDDGSAWNAWIGCIPVVARLANVERDVDESNVMMIRKVWFGVF